MNENNINQQVLEESKIDYFEWLIAIGEDKIIIIITAFIFSIASVIYCLVVTPTYTAKTVIMPNNSQQNLVTSAMSMIGTVANIGGVVKTQDDYYISLLQSDNLLNGVIQKLELQEIYKTDKLIDARQRLKAIYRVTSDKKGGFIVVEADNKDPEFSAKIANTFVEELKNLLGKIALASAKQRLLFYEKAISKTENDLADAKAKFQDANEKSGVLSNSTLTENIYNQISNKELQISAMSHFSTAQNPDVRRLEAELAALRGQLFKSSENNNAKLKESALPQQTAINAYREIKSLELILGALTSQYRASLAEAFSSDPFVQQIEVATPPERRSKPQRTAIVLYYSLLGLIIGFVISIVKIHVKKIVQNESFSSKMTQLRKSWINLSLN
jgi:tyrosine-protein kinase Etk/Wzc